MNYLLPITLATERLRACIPSLPIKTGLDFSQVKDLGEGGEVWVIFNSDTVVDTSAIQTLLDMKIAVIYMAKGLLPDLNRDGEILTLITKALAGYEPEERGLGTFKRSGSMIPQSLEGDGIVVYGMAFSIIVSL